MAGLKRREILAMLAAIGAGAPAIAWELAGPVQERLPWGEDRYADAGFHAGTRMEQRAKRRRQSWLESLFG